MYRQQAYSFIEMLISLALLSGTMLSFMATQIASYSFLDEALQYAYANQLAYDLFERIRANPHALDAYVDDGEIPTSLTSGSCSAETCNADYLARYDRQQWQQRLENGLLPAAKACISLTERRIHLHLVWQDKYAATAQAIDCNNAQLPHLSRHLVL